MNKKTKDIAKENKSGYFELKISGKFYCECGSVEEWSNIVITGPEYSMNGLCGKCKKNRSLSISYNT